MYSLILKITRFLYVFFNLQNVLFSPQNYAFQENQQNWTTQENFYVSEFTGETVHSPANFQNFFEFTNFVIFKSFCHP